jgi:hypothetical protein
MMGQRQVDQAALFYEFSLERARSRQPLAEVNRSLCRSVAIWSHSIAALLQSTPA